MAWPNLDPAHVVTTRSVGLNQAVEDLNRLGRLRQVGSTRDQLAVSNPQHGKHIATNVTTAKFNQLTQADPLNAQQRDQQRADRILTAAGVPITNISGPERIQLAKLLVSHNQLAQDIGSAFAAANGGTLPLADAQALLSWATDNGPLKDSKFALAQVTARLFASDRAAGNSTAFAAGLIQLGAAHPTLARQLATLTTNVTVFHRPAAESLANVANRSLASQMAALALQSPASLPALTAMIGLGGQVTFPPGNLAAQFNALRPQATNATGREALLEIFRHAPALTCKDKIWSINVAQAGGHNLTALEGDLNTLQQTVIKDRLAGLTSAGVTNAAQNLANTLHLDTVGTNRFLNKLADKLEFGEANANKLQTEITGGDLSSLVKIWAETASATQIDNYINSISGGDRVELLGRLVADGKSYPGIREGADRLLTSLEPNMPVQLQEAVPNLRSGYWNRQEFSKYVATHPQHGPFDFQATAAHADADAVQRYTGPNGFQTKLNHQSAAIGNRLHTVLTTLGPGQVEALTGLTPGQATALQNALANPINPNQADAFAKLFGSEVEVPQVNLSGPAHVAMSAPEKRSLALYAQMIRQIDAIANHPGDFATGLQRIAMTLPTAGKRLEDLTFVPTMVRELQATLNTAGQGGQLVNFPILVFDQTTDPNLLQANQNYLATLANQTGARIEHITLQTIQQFEQKLGIRGMFDTTGNNRAGYAGARNIANLLGPMLQHELQNNPLTTVDNVLNNNNAAQLKLLLQQQSLTNQGMVIMGDDDASVMPGFLHAKALIAMDNPGTYITSKTFLDGRGTTNARPVNDPSGAPLTNHGVNLREMIMGTANWLSYNMSPVMATACSSPGACVNLPTPSEESHFAVFKPVADGLSRATHYAGDRYEDFPVRLKAFVSYSSQGLLAEALLDCGKNYQTSPVLPWNSAGAMADLSAIFNYGALPNTRQGMQKAFFSRLRDFESQGALNELYATDYPRVFNEFLEKEFDSLSPTQRREFEDIRAAYQTVKADLQLGVAFRNEFLQQLRRDFNALPQVGSWGAVNTALLTNAPNAVQQMLDYLVDQDHNFANAADQARQNLVNAGTGDPSANASPLAQIVYLTSKAIGAGQFNQHLHTLTH